jgi:hypothetical protein
MGGEPLRSGGLKNPKLVAKSDALGGSEGVNELEWKGTVVCW